MRREQVGAVGDFATGRARVDDLVADADRRGRAAPTATSVGSGAGVNSPIAVDTRRAKKKSFGRGTYSPNGTRWTLWYGGPARPSRVSRRAAL